MTIKIEESTQYIFEPVTPDRWKDFQQLFGERGACGGCWCMWFRLKRSEFDKQKGEANRQAMKEIITSGNVPGILAYSENKPVGWCSVAPRKELPVLDRSRILKPVDNIPVWSVVCFFINKHYRKKGLTLLLLKAAIHYVKELGGTVLEGYPVEPQKQWPDTFVYYGLTSVFEQAGFTEEVRRSNSRPIMRFYLE